MSAKSEGIAPNASRLLWAGFMAILAAGVGFAIRGAILGTWEATFKFTGLEVGLINGAGFTGFCFGIVIGGIIADKIGYGKLVVAAFVLHILSAVVAFSVADTMDAKTAFALLWTGTFLFAVANGTLEAVANPLVATLFPNNRAHYLNILHASWPAGMVLGGFAAQYFGGSLEWGWKAQLCLFLVPTLIYGLMFMAQKFPQSEASQKGLSLGQMLKDVGVVGAAVIGLFIGLFVKDGLGPLLGGFTGSDFFVSTTWTYLSIALGVGVWTVFSGLSGWAFGSFLLFVLFIVHAMIGAVELGTDGWIQNITGTILTPSAGTTLFIFTSAIMFGLRFCTHFIEKNLKLSPVGLLLVCSILACLGLNLVSGIQAFGGALGALAVYAVGKTFFWPTMLAVVSDRFPRTGAVAISIMGGIGMMSAGLIGSPGLGYAKDRFAAESVPAESVSTMIGSKESKWLMFDSVKTLDGEKLGASKAALKVSVEETIRAGVDDPKTALAKLPEDQRKLIEADVAGARKTLKADSFIPATMAVVFLLLLLYFKAIGGYKVVRIDEQSA
jgi:DHA2 family metal-tetracycline-proton antiporter-like MFS transporter